MASQHATVTITWRAPEELKRGTQAELDARGLQMSAFLNACMAELNADPDRALERLMPHWPPRAYGRGGVITTWRAPEDLKRVTQAVLEVRDKARRRTGLERLQMSAFINACMAELNADPDRALERLKSHWPAPRPLGRPPG